jgi:hypothetical protein
MATTVFQREKNVEGQRTPLGYERITGLSTAKGLTVPSSLATLVLLRPESQSVRIRDDGVDPTAGVGFPLNANDVFEYTGDLSAIKFIEITASAVLHALYYK